MFLLILWIGEKGIDRYINFVLEKPNLKTSYVKSISTLQKFTKPLERYWAKIYFHKFNSPQKINTIKELR